MRLFSVSLAIAMSGLALAPAAVEAVTRTPYDTNLLLNGGAELGGASFDGNQVVNIPGWSQNHGFTVVAYGTAGGFPTIGEAGRIGGKDQFFSAGQVDSSSECGQASQTVTIKGRNAAIDAGHVKVVVTGRLGTYLSQPDTAVLYLLPGPDRIYGVTASRTNTNTKLVKISVSTILRPGERWAGLILSASSTVGYCDAYFDNLKLKIVHV